jgi:phospholipid transport system substrate-binding protein
MRYQQSYTYVVTGLVSVLLLLLSTTVVFAKDDAVVLVENTTQAIKTAIKKDYDVLLKDKKKLMELVDKIVLPHFDFDKMSSWALGKSWKNAKPDEKEKFTAEFRKLLVRTYAAALLDNVDRKISILPPSKKSETKVIVHTEVAQDGGFPIPIDYKMHFKSDKWKVYDVVIDGISLVSNYRTSFATEIRKSGVSSVIASLRERNKSAIK